MSIGRKAAHEREEKTQRRQGAKTQKGRVRQFSPAMSALTAKAGNVQIKAYATGRGGWIIPWYDPYGVRKLVMRSTKAAAKKFADDKAEELSRGSVRLQRFKDQLSEADMREWLEALETLNPHGVHLGQAIREWAATRTKANGAQRPIPELVQDLLAAKRAEDAGVRWVDDLESRLTRFAKAFPWPLQEVTEADVRTWLTRLNLSKRSFNNYRAAIVYLVQFAKDRKYLDSTWNNLANIKPWKLVKGEEELYTPEEFRSLLFTAEKHYPQHLPALAIMGLAGCRHSELRDATAALDWRDVHFSPSPAGAGEGGRRPGEGCGGNSEGIGTIHIRETVAKSNTGRRYVPMQANLAAWLETHARPRGAVCPVENLTNALARIAAKAGVTWKRNALRNSFISYRCAVLQDVAKVALEAGNSVSEIHRSYRKEITVEEAARWWQIWPTKADVLPLFAHAKLVR